MKTLVKICGIGRIEDALVAADCGADFIGLIFAPRSKRRVGVDDAARIVEAVRRHRQDIELVGVFVDEHAERVRSTAERVGLDLVQYHGAESEELIEEVGLPAIRVRRVGSAPPSFVESSGAEWILYDTSVAGEDGGTGRTFDWSLLREHPREHRFFLSGGLDATNVRRAIATVRPNAVDLCSGVEESPGIKSRKKIEELMRQVMR